MTKRATSSRHTDKQSERDTNETEESHYRICFDLITSRQSNKLNAISLLHISWKKKLALALVLELAFSISSSINVQSLYHSPYHSLGH